MLDKGSGTIEHIATSVEVPLLAQLPSRAARTACENLKFLPFLRIKKKKQSLYYLRT